MSAENKGDGLISPNLDLLFQEITAYVNQPKQTEQEPTQPNPKQKQLTADDNIYEGAPY